MGTAGCGEPARSWELGVEPKDVVAWGEGALIFDRIAGLPGWDPNLGVAWFLAPGEEPEPLYSTAKNTGFASLDPTTGWVWVNSEGSGEVVALEPSSGESALRVWVGGFVDGLTLDPNDPGTSFATGRVSDQVARIEEDEVVLTSRGEVRWPWSPVLHASRAELWMWSQTGATLHALDATTLEPPRTVDLGLPPGVSLVFAGLAVHPERGTLFAAQAGADTLWEVDPGTGEVLESWDLGGRPLTDLDLIGELLVRVDSETGAVVVGRSTDARVQRLDPDTGELLGAYLGEEGVLALISGGRIDFLRLVPEARLVYAAGLALDLDTLERVPDEDRPASRIIAPWPSRPGHLLGVDEEGRELVHWDGKGREKGRMGFAERDLSAMVFRLDREEREVVVGRSRWATVCRFDIDGVR